MTEETRSKRRYRKQPARVAYTVPLPFGKTLGVKESANAWWMEATKLGSLITCFQAHFTIEQACTCVGITVKQYKYFVSLHPEFAEAREGYRLMPDMQAQMVIMKSLQEGNIKTAWWWATHKMRDQYGAPSRAQGVRMRKIQQLEAMQKNEPRDLVFEQLADEYDKELKKRLSAANKV